MKRRGSIVVAWLGLLVLVALHIDFWRPQRAVFHFGWIPEELLYRLAWVLLAWVYLLFVCSVVWTSSPEPESVEGDAGGEQ
jgi:hypothetical protein